MFQSTREAVRNIFTVHSVKLPVASSCKSHWTTQATATSKQEKKNKLHFTYISFDLLSFLDHLLPSSSLFVSLSFIGSAENEQASYLRHFLTYCWSLVHNGDNNFSNPINVITKHTTYFSFHSFLWLIYCFEILHLYLEPVWIMLHNCEQYTCKKSTNVAVKYCNRDKHCAAL